MKLIDVHIDGFGVWSGLELRSLSPQWTVYYGPNEAGKTTLLQFIRAVLYGFSPQRRQRYLPPVHGGITGGALLIEDAEGQQLQIRRRDDDLGRLGNISIEWPSGSFYPETSASKLLHDVDETTFENVFAIGLHELQELGTLNDTDAAKWLYSLSAGLDRVSLVEVLAELQHSRARMFSAGDQPSQVGELLAERDRLQRELEAYYKRSAQYGEFIAERAADDHTIAQLDQAIPGLNSAQRMLEAAVAVHPHWQRRLAIEAQIQAIGPHDEWPVDAAERLDRLSAGIAKRRRFLQRATQRRRQLRGELAKFTLREPLWRQSARIAALGEHESWVVGLERDSKAAEAALEGLLHEQTNQFERVEALAQLSAKEKQDTQWLKHLGDLRWNKLQRPAEKLVHARRHAKTLRQKLEQDHAAALNRRRDLESALGAGGAKGGGTAPQQNRDGQSLIAAVETAGQRVTELRHRVQLDEKIGRLVQTKSDLEQQSIDLMERQILPPWMLLAIGGVFVLGVVLILAGLLLPHSFIGNLGWPMAWLGILGTGSAIAAKFSIEHSHSKQLDTTKKQLGMAETQMAQAKQERDDFDRAQPNGRGTPAARLQVAEQELAKLEKLLPLEGQRQTAAQEMVSAEDQMRQATRPYRKARRRWRAALVHAGMPDDLTPQQAKRILQARRHCQSVDAKIAAARAEIERIGRELSSIGGRVEQVFRDVLVTPRAAQVSDRIRQLRGELADEETQRKERDALRRRRIKLHVRRRKAGRQLVVLKRRRRRLLKQCRAIDLAEFRRKAAEYSQIGGLIAQREGVAKEIATVLAGVANDSVIAGLLAEKTLLQLEDDRAAAKRRWEEATAQHRRLLEQRGARNEQIRLLADDRQGAVKRFELAQLECQLAAAVERWKVFTVTERLLKHVKDDYERNRQPETLREASEYLARLTAGRYRRVWTRFGDNLLLVDDHQNTTLPIEVLSHGTREQLFLSLRLALVSLFARRGVALPMVLDDVLVNFDHERAMASVDVLIDFAKHGHQLLMFTCHEHLARLLRARNVDVRQLPEHAASGSDRPFEIDLDPPPRRLRTRRVKEVIPVAEVLVEEPEPVVAPPLPVAAAVTISPVPLPDPPEQILREFVPPVQIPVPPVVRQQQVRIDPPQQVVRYSPIMQRWSAEEFRGELDDQVNPFWHQLATTNFEPAGVPTFAVTIHENHSPAMAAAKTKMLRLFDGDSTALVEDTVPGNDDWDL